MATLLESPDFVMARAGLSHQYICYLGLLDLRYTCYWEVAVYIARIDGISYPYNSNYHSAI